MPTKKKAARKKADKVARDNPPGEVWVMNTSGRNFFTDRGCLKPGECALCGVDVAKAIVDKGAGEIVS